MRSRSKAREKRIIPILIIIFIVIIIVSALLIWYILSNNYITIENIDNSASNVSDSVVNNGRTLIVNNIIVGGVNEKSWISSQKIYEKNKDKDSIDIDMYNNNSMLGTYKTATLKKYENAVVYTTTTKVPQPENYIAIESADKNINVNKMTKLEPTKQDEKHVKEALGKYKLLNNTVKITEVYETYITGGSDKIICALSEKSGMFGTYSAVVYVSGSKAKLIKYSYVKNVKSSSTWPIYSAKFSIDINGDGLSELVLQETTENAVSYSIVELKNNEFYQVLKTTILI